MVMKTHCKSCGKKPPMGWDRTVCPYCGDIMTEIPNAISLGDANAFAGDVSIAVTNTKVERQKDAKEIKAENISHFRSLCKELLADGILTTEDSIQLEDSRILLGLTKEEANNTLESVRIGLQRYSKNSLGRIQQVSLNQIIKLMEAGKIDNLRSSLGRLEIMAQKYDADEVQCNYWMLLSGLDPELCIRKFENRDSDNYWKSYWTTMAYINLGNSAAAEGNISDLEAWGNMPFGNIALLAAANSLCEYWKDPTISDFKDQAEAFIEEGVNGNTDLIDAFAQTLILLLGVDNTYQLEEFRHERIFLMDYVLKGITERISLYSAMKDTPKMPKIELLPE